MKTLRHFGQTKSSQIITLIITVSTVAIVGTILLISSHAATPSVAIEAENGTQSGTTSITDPTASNGKAIQFNGTTGSCVVTALLVNPCRPWLGAAVNNYATGSLSSEIASHESRIGQKLDIIHDYRVGGQVLSADDVTYANRVNTILLVNFKPTANQAFATGDGSNATVNGWIDNMASSIKALGSTKVMLAIYHEPENDVSPGGDPNCPSVPYVGNKGSVTDYVNMWHNVRSRFDRAGVTNVVWVMNYMGFSKWTCLFNDLWPGNSYVDWVMYDPYGNTYTSAVSSFYDFMTNNSNAAHDYTSKPWGLAEWGTGASTQSTAYAFYDQAKTDLDNNTFPRLKAYVIWDNAVAGGIDFRVQYNLNGALDQNEQNHYNTFANDPKINGAFTGL